MPSGFSATLDLEAVAKGRPRMTKTGRTYTPQKTRDAEALVQAAIRPLKPKCLVGPLQVILNFVLKRPKSSKRPYPTVRPDLDNYAKLVLDAIQGLCFEDDAQVVQLILTKAYGPRPAIYLTIHEV